MNDSPADLAQVYLIPRNFLDSIPSIDKIIIETKKVADEIVYHMSDQKTLTNTSETVRVLKNIMKL